MTKKVSNKKTTSKKLAKVTGDMNLADVVWKYPKAAEVLMDYGLHCVGCAANSLDTVEMGAKLHGMPNEEIAEMIDRINEVISTGE